MATPKELIERLIADKSVATPQDVAAHLAISPQLVTDIETLRTLSNIKEFEEITLTDPHHSVVWFNFRPDWSCDSSGYGYRDIVADIRKGLHARCTDGKQLRLASRLKH